MSYSNSRGLGSGVTQKSPPPRVPPIMTPAPAPVRQTAAPAVMTPSAPALMFTPDMSAVAAGRAASAPPVPYRAAPTAAKIAHDAAGSIVTAECADYRYVPSYRPMDRAGIVRAGTPVVAGRKISWDPSIVGAAFPRSWVDWRNHNAGTSQLVVDTNTRTARPGLPATSTALLTAETKCFLIGFKMLGTNEGVLYVGAVSTRDVDTEKMQYFLKDLLRTPARVEPLWPALIAYAVVPSVTPESASIFYPPITDSVARPELIGSRYSIHTAKAVAISAAIALKEALVAMISGEIFGGMAVARAPALFIPGESEVLAAVTAIGGAPALAEMPAQLTSAMATMTAEAEAAKSMTPEAGDRAVADVLARLTTMRDALSTDLSGRMAAIAAGVAALPDAQAAAGAYARNSFATEAETRRLMQDKINLVESKPGFLRLSDGEKHAVHCIMLNRAAPIIASRVAVAQPRVDALAAINAADFATTAAGASASYQQALSSANATLSEAIARVEEIRKQIALAWYARDFHGFPVWMWGAGGAAVLVAGAVAVRVMRKKTPAAATAAK